MQTMTTSPKQCHLWKIFQWTMHTAATQTTWSPQEKHWRRSHTKDHGTHDDAAQTMPPLEKYATGQCIPPSPNDIVATVQTLALQPHQRSSRPNVAAAASEQMALPLPPNRWCCHCLQKDRASTQRNGHPNMPLPSNKQRCQTNTLKY